MVEKNMVFKNPNWKETDQLAILKSAVKELHWGQLRTNAVRIRMEGLNSGRPDY